MVEKDEVATYAYQGSLVGIFEFYADVVGSGMFLLIVFQADVFDKETVLESDKCKWGCLEPFCKCVCPGEDDVDPDFVLVESPIVQFLVNGVITGWTTALQYMHPGDVWRIYIPYSLAYGESGNSSGSVTIPGYSTLIFDVELYAFKRTGSKEWTKK